LSPHDHTKRRTTVGGTHLDERTARRRDIYLTTHTHTHSQIHAWEAGEVHTAF